MAGKNISYVEKLTLHCRMTDNSFYFNLPDRPSPSGLKYLYLVFQDGLGDEMLWKVLYDPQKGNKIQKCQEELARYACNYLRIR